MAALDGLEVLLAEDNPTNQIVAVQMLETLGASVTLAADGEEALALAAARRFDLALIDIEMPAVSGLEVIRRLRAGPAEIAAMPMIALTAYVMREHREAIERAGADGVIAKPILSIEKMAEDILAMTRARRGEPAPAARPAPAPEPAPLRQRTPGRSDRIDLGIFDALAASIGREEMPGLLEKIEEDLRALRSGIAEGCATGDRGTVRRASHSLISIAGAIGALRLQHAAQCLNSAAHKGEIDDLRGIGSGLLSEIDAVSGFVRDCLCNRD